MLVLTRKRNEQIKIGENIVITVVESSRGSVKLGIQAPHDVRVLRAELTELPAPVLDSEVDAEEEQDLMNVSILPEPTLQQFHFEMITELEDQASRYLAQ